MKTDRPATVARSTLAAALVPATIPGTTRIPVIVGPTGTAI